MSKRVLVHMPPNLVFELVARNVLKTLHLGGVPGESQFSGRYGTVPFRNSVLTFSCTNFLAHEVTGSHGQGRAC